MSSKFVVRTGWLVVVLAVCAYGAALAGDFVFDDVHSVSGNPALQSLSNLWQFWTDPGAFSGASARMYRPTLLTSFALNIAVSPEAWSLKAGNVAIHAAVSGLLFAWLWRLSRRARAAFVVAALFAVHPLSSEAINLISARSELLSTFGILLAMWAHVGWQRGSRDSRGVGALLLMALGTVIACGSKETGVVLPGLLLVQTFCLRHRLPTVGDWRRSLLSLVPVLGLVVVYLIARKLLLGEATVQLLGRSGGDAASGHGRTLVVQLATMGTLLPRMFWQAIAPTHLALDPIVVYRESFLDPVVLIGWGSMLALTAAGLCPGPTARLRRIGTATAWAIALPWIVIPLNMPFAEHRFYGPVLGMCIVALPLMPRLARSLSRAPKPAVRTAFALLLLLAIGRSASRSLLYQDERELWRAELAHNPESFRAWWGLGTSHMRRQDMVAAIDPLRRAHALYPQHHDTLRNCVEALVAVPDEHADPDAALALSNELRTLSPDDPWVRTLVVQANLQAGRVGRGDAHFELAEQIALSCLEIAEPKGYVYQLAAFARHGMGQPEAALAHLDTSIERGLATVPVRLDRAKLLHELGRTQSARQAIFALQREYPTDPKIMFTLRHLAAPPK